MTENLEIVDRVNQCCNSCVCENLHSSIPPIPEEE
jgi:hypothetical protein